MSQESTGEGWLNIFLEVQNSFSEKYNAIH